MLHTIRISVPPPGLVPADFYVTSNADMTALMATQGVAGLSGKTIALYPGDYTWDEAFWNNRVYTAETTFTSAFTENRARLLCGASYGNEIRSPKNLTLYRLKIFAEFDTAIHDATTADGSGIRVKGGIDGFRINQCELWSNLRQIVADEGYPPNMGEVTYKGILGTDGTSQVLSGGYHITDCTFHGSKRLLQLPPRAGAGAGGPTVVVGNRFYDMGVDALFISGYQSGLKVNWNHFDSPLNGWDGSDIAVTCDPVANTFTSAAPHGLTGTTTVNLSPNMQTGGGVPPVGINYSQDFFVTRVDDYTLSISGVDPTTAGSGVRIYKEPSHADFIQGGAKNAGWDGFEIIGNTVTVARYDSLDSKKNCQVLFLEDINDGFDTYHYNNGVIFGNLIYSHTNHGISLYNPYNCLIANNVLVGLNSSGNGPPVAIRQQNGASANGTASGNTIAGNIAHTTTAFAGTTITGNINKSLSDDNIDDELVETVLEPQTRQQMISRFTIRSTGAAFLQTPKAGGPGSGHIDYAARTWVSPW